jgi:hypothetical protein
MSCTLVPRNHLIWPYFHMDMEFSSKNIRITEYQLPRNQGFVSYYTDELCFVHRFMWLVTRSEPEASD